MAIRNRRGLFRDFDKANMVPGEFAFVLSGDPSASDGAVAYLCFGAGIVKRMASYEDMADFLASVKEETVTWIVDTANAGFKEEYAHVRDDAKAAEAARAAAEALRNTAESGRTDAESKRAVAEGLRIAAEENRVALYDDLMAKLEARYFDGATFTPSVSEDGVLSWLNDKGLPNPESVDVRGPKGNDGVVTQLAAGMYGLKVVDGRLKLICGAASQPPDLYLEGGHLFLKIGE